MWPFNRKQRVTSREFAAALLEPIGKSAKDFCAYLQKYAEDQWPNFGSDEVAVLVKEIFIGHLWMVSKLFARDQKALDLLHTSHLSVDFTLAHKTEEQGKLADTAQTELFERYGKYYEAWNNDMKTKGGSALSFEMAQFLFPKRKPVLDFMVLVEIQMRISAFMITTADFRKTYEIIDV